MSQFAGGSSEVTWEKLSQVAAKGAEYDSRERQPHPKCLEGTRVVLLNHIHELLDNQEKSRLVWLHGTAGVGKSAVAFTVAERMTGLKMRGQVANETRLAGSFFFSRKHTARCTTGYFFATLAYQLASNFPSVKEDVNRVILENPALLDPDTSLRKQMNELFLLPLRNLRLRLRECLPLVFVIDALDECRSEADLADLISLLGQALREPDLPMIHILLTSRSEEHICEAFRGEEVHPLVCEVPVKTSGAEGVAAIISLDGADVDNDIYIFLEHSFKKLRRHRSEFPHLTKAELAQLASRAGRRFIVASTMMKFIDDGYNDPRDRLQLMLRLTNKLLGGTQVYKLYDSILNTCTDPKRAYFHLSVAAALADPLPISQISKLLGPGQGKDVEITLMQLRSVMDIPTDRSLPVNIYHSSIRDYVSDTSNCSLLSQVRDIPSPHSILALSSFRLMMQDPQESTTLLDILSELKKHSEDIPPEDPGRLIDTLDFIVQPPESLQILVGLLWFRGDYSPDFQFWLETLDGHSWLQTGEGKCWLQNEWWISSSGSIHLPVYKENEIWLRSPGGKDWLETESGREWLETQRWQDSGLGRETHSTSMKHDWHRRLMQTLQEQGSNGQEVPQTSSGRDPPLALSEQEPVPDARGTDFLLNRIGSEQQRVAHRSNTLHTMSRRELRPVQIMPEQLELACIPDLLQTTRGQAWLRSPHGETWLRTRDGKDWLQTRSGRDWLQTEIMQQKQTLHGRDRVQNRGVGDWLQSEIWRGWLQTENGQRWLRTKSGQEWLQTEGGQDWLQTESAKDWLQTESGRGWLWNESGQDWLQTKSGQEWLRTECGRDWLQTKSGRDWLRMPTGQAWKLTLAASIWAIMEDFSGTLEAMRNVPHKTALGLCLPPAVQVIREFQSLPDFLMLPVFLALRHQDHSTSALPPGHFLPDVEIIHTMKAFVNFANAAQERSQSSSDASKYAYQNWAFHLLRTSTPWDDTLNDIFKIFWNDHLLSWLERQWCLKGLRSCLIVLSECQELVKEHPRGRTLDETPEIVEGQVLISEDDLKPHPSEGRVLLLDEDLPPPPLEGQVLILDEGLQPPALEGQVWIPDENPQPPPLSYILVCITVILFSMYLSSYEGFPN